MVVLSAFSKSTIAFAVHYNWKMAKVSTLESVFKRSVFGSRKRLIRAKTSQTERVFENASVWTKPQYVLKLNDTSQDHSGTQYLFSVLSIYYSIHRGACELRQTKYSVKLYAIYVLAGHQTHTY